MKSRGVLATYIRVIKKLYNGAMSENNRRRQETLPIEVINY